MDEFTSRVTTREGLKSDELDWDSPVEDDPSWFITRSSFESYFLCGRPCMNFHLESYLTNLQQNRLNILNNELTRPDKTGQNEHILYSQLKGLKFESS